MGSTPAGGGETAKDPSGWSTDTLKSYIERVVHESDRRYEQRFIAQEKAVASALEAAEKATNKYERDVERWRQASNEWRSAMDDREVKFVAMETFQARLTALDAKVDDLTKSRDIESGRRLAQTAIMGFVAIAVSIALRFL